MKEEFNFKLGKAVFIGLLIESILVMSIIGLFNIIFCFFN